MIFLAILETYLSLTFTFFVRGRTETFWYVKLEMLTIILVCWGVHKPAIHRFSEKF